MYLCEITNLVERDVSITDISLEAKVSNWRDGIADVFFLIYLKKTLFPINGPKWITGHRPLKCPQAL